MLLLLGWATRGLIIESDFRCSLKLLNQVLSVDLCVKKMDCTISVQAQKSTVCAMTACVPVYKAAQS